MQDVEQAWQIMLESEYAEVLQEVAQVDCVKYCRFDMIDWRVDYV